MICTKKNISITFQFKMKQDPFNESEVEPSSLSFVAIKKKLNQYVDLDDFLADIKRLGAEYKTKFSSKFQLF